MGIGGNPTRLLNVPLLAEEGVLTFTRFQAEEASTSFYHTGLAHLSYLLLGLKGLNSPPAPLYAATRVHSTLTSRMLPKPRMLTKKEWSAIQLVLFPSRALFILILDISL